MASFTVKVQGIEKKAGRENARPGRGTDRLLTADFVSTTLANFANAFGMQMLVARCPCTSFAWGEALPTPAW
jgi:hypothetical protein